MSNDMEDDNEVQKQWDEFIPDLTEAIEAGWMDAHLRKIMQVAIKRAQMIGQIKPSAPKNETDPELAAHQHDSLVQDARALTRPDFAGILTGKVVPVRTAASIDTSTLKNFFEYDGYVYKKSDIVGWVLMIPTSTRDHSGAHKWAGKHVQVTGVGSKSFKVRPVNAQASGKMTLPIADESGFIDKKFLDIYLGKVIV